MHPINATCIIIIVVTIVYLPIIIIIIVFLFFSIRFQCPESKQQLGPAVRVHLQRTGANEGKTGTYESLDFDQEADLDAKLCETRRGINILY